MILLSFLSNARESKDIPEYFKKFVPTTENLEEIKINACSQIAKLLFQPDIECRVSVRDKVFPFLSMLGLSVLLEFLGGKYGQVHGLS